MPNLIEQRVAEARQGENPAVVCRMPSGWLVLGDTQFIPGYCLLLADPVVPSLNTLARAERVQFLADMALIGDVLLEVTDAYRINYEILGNTEPALHVHIVPRYLAEPEEARKVPIWMGYNSGQFHTRPFSPNRDRDLMEQIASAIQKEQ